MSTIAWYGRVKMHEAKWTDREGSTVTFRLPMDPQAERMRNPFQSFTKRRKGHAGTRFMMACHRVAGQDRVAVYEDEAMLAGWNDSQSTGHTVKFWLCADILGHPFEGFDRKLDDFVISLVELDDDEEPIDQKMRQRVEKGSIAVSERASYVAAMLCKNPVFWRWVSWRQHKPPVFVESEEQCVQWLYKKLGIQSRAELDSDDEKARQFHAMVRKPFVEWDTSDGNAPPPF